MRTLRARMPAMTVSTMIRPAQRLAPGAEATSQCQMLRPHLDSSFFCACPYRKTGFHFSGTCAGGSQARHGPRRFRRDDVPCEAEACQQADRPEHRIELPCATALHRGLWVGVMIVVPSLAVREIPNEEIVSAVVVGFVATVAPEMRSRIDEGGDVPDVDGSGRNAPDEHARGNLRSRLRVHARK